jgi:cell division protein FtsL
VAKRRVGRGRWIIAGGLIVFVIVGAAVIARRSYGHREGLELTALQRRKAALESERVELRQQIRDASSRSVIVPLAERRLGMHLPEESQIVMLKAASNGSP